MRGPPPQMPPPSMLTQMFTLRTRVASTEHKRPSRAPETLRLLRNRGLAPPNPRGMVLEGTALPEPRAPWPVWNSCAEGRCCWGEGWAQWAPQPCSLGPLAARLPEVYRCTRSRSGLRLLTAVRKDVSLAT